MNIVLFDEPSIRTQLLPFTFTRPVANIRTGIVTIAEKWQHYLGEVSFLTEAYLAEKFPVKPGSDNLLINGALCPDEQVVKAIQQIPLNTALVKQGNLLAIHSTTLEWNNAPSTREYAGEVVMIDQVWKIFQHNAQQIRADYPRITAGRKSAPITDKYTRAYNEDQVFLEEGVTLRAAVLNAEDGPIYLGKNSVVQEGALIKGPFALCEGSHVNMGGKMRGDTTIGPFSKVGGEISNSVIFGYSNKAHDGFLGNSVLGEWCNLGADTNTSNLKNNYENVKIWSYAKGGFHDTGLQFCGLMMGDHSKSGINTMFNTGTVVGVSANIFGDGFPRTFIPSFAWGGTSGFTTFQLNKAFETAGKVMARRSRPLDEVEKNILKHVFEQSAPNRIWEKK
jgi:UDP-N-acetylglucosamine diphosphorylase/glucosamine-1-phosphate N-acetyltransferase